MAIIPQDLLGHIDNPDVGLCILECMLDTFRNWQDRGLQWIPTTRLIQGVRDGYDSHTSNGLPKYVQLGHETVIGSIQGILAILEEQGEVQFKHMDGDLYCLNHQ